jgi:hypothetical protein
MRPGLPGSLLASEGLLLRTAFLPPARRNSSGLLRFEKLLIDSCGGSGHLRQSSSPLRGKDQARQNEASGSTVPGMAFVNTFTSRYLRCTGVSLTLSRVTAGLVAGRWCSGRDF